MRTAKAHKIITAAQFPIETGFSNGGAGHRHRNMLIVYDAIKKLGPDPHTTHTIRNVANADLKHLETMGALVDLETIGLVAGYGTTWSPSPDAKHLRSQEYQRIWRIK